MTSHDPGTRPGIDPADLRTTLAVLAAVEERAEDHPDAVAVRRATARIFKAVRKQRRRAKRAEVLAESLLFARLHLTRSDGQGVDNVTSSSADRG